MNSLEKLLAIRSYKEALTKAVTTFHLPHYTIVGMNNEVIIEPYEFRKMPFNAIHIVEPFTIAEDAEAMLAKASGRIPKGEVIEGIDNVVFYQERSGDDIMLRYSGMLKMPNGQVVHYDDTPKHQASGRHSSVTVLKRLLEYLRSRTVRYIEEPTTKQVRKYLGVADTYKHYIIVPKGATRYEHAVPRQAIIKRLMTLNVVPRHERTYKHDRYVNMKGKKQIIEPYTRGGTPESGVQVKDYIIRS